MAIDYDEQFSKENINFEIFKNKIVRGNISEPSRGKKDDFYEHIQMLEKEFSKRSFLEFYCIWLIVKIRRKIDLEISIESFFHLWKKETDFLCKRLSARWLISVCDTYIDHAQSDEEKGYAFGAVFFMNTIKLYETERKMYNWMTTPGNVQFLTAKTQLFDGITAYNAKGGDMISNMVDRVKIYMNSNIVTADIFYELIQRSNTGNTVFLRMSRHHKDLKRSNI